MKYKVIVTDYDGTYIKNDKTVSPSQLKAVKDFISRGGYFIVCTGRMTSGIDHFLLKDGFDGYLASFNGGEIVNLKTGEVLYKNQIDNATCVEITEYAKEHNLNIYGYPNRSFITEKEDEKTEFYNDTGIGTITNPSTHIKLDNEIYKSGDRITIQLNKTYSLGVGVSGSGDYNSIDDNITFIKSLFSLAVDNLEVINHSFCLSLYSFFRKNIFVFRK